MDRDDATARALADSRRLRQDVLAELQRVTGWELTFLTRVDGDRLEVLDVAGESGWLESGTQVPLEDTPCARMIDGRAPAATACASSPEDPIHDAAARVALGIESYSGHVVRGRDGAPLGTLCAIDRGSRHAGPEARRLGEIFARLLSWELEREATLRDLTAQARTDPLTGLVNRTGLLERLEAEIAEFAWLLPGTDVEAAHDAADRARQAVAQATFSPGAELTISAGVAALADAADGAELYLLADRALYAAKALGRNRCVRHVPHASGAAPDDARALVPAPGGDAVLAVHGLALELGWPAGRVALVHESGRRHVVGRVGVPESLDVRTGT